MYVDILASTLPVVLPATWVVAHFTAFISYITINKDNLQSWWFTIKKQDKKVGGTKKAVENETGDTTKNEQQRLKLLWISCLVFGMLIAIAGGFLLSHIKILWYASYTAAIIPPTLALSLYGLRQKPWKCMASGAILLLVLTIIRASWVAISLGFLNPLGH